jgi:regulator of cell morphogenesis and NO signaling
MTKIMVARGGRAYVRSMTQIDPNLTVSELTRTVPGAFRVFERHGIDFCCGGKIPLTQACADKHVPLDALVQALAASSEPHSVEAPEGVTALIAHIIEQHHVFESAELKRLAPLADKVIRVHGGRHPELAEVGRLMRELTADLLPHMQKEELVLFPAMRALETGERGRACFATIAQPLSVMLAEHEQVGQLLRDLERVSDRYTPPDNACGSYRALYEGLAELQADVHRHIYLENELLFPRASALEVARRA